MVVYSDGTITQTPPGIFTSSCPIDIKWFPFDDQFCELMFGSWTYDGTKIDLQIKDGAETGSLDGYSRSGEWDLLGQFHVTYQHLVVIYMPSYTLHRLMQEFLE